ncbi:MAG: organoarsenical effux MFS transporter ArsJ [Arenicella sp.]|nr:organoarsenical effux MFS transporter ArsJ [Arenicella sp.]
MLRQYQLITANYWAFTLTDGALRMLVVLYFHQLGYAPLDIALLFVFYEAFGVVTNLVGGWLGARIGLNKTMNIGLFLQIVALSLLLVPTSFLSVAWVMAAQALSGIAKDLNKMSAKSAIKHLVPAGHDKRLLNWVALLTGSKNTLKGVGFFLGGVLLSTLQFHGAILTMTVALSLVWILSLITLRHDFGRNSSKPKFTAVFSTSKPINYLSAARMFLFGSRDVWFVIALPVFLANQLQWSQSYIGGFLATWVILYGLVQSLTPKLIATKRQTPLDGRSAFIWAALLAIIPIAIATGIHLQWPTTLTIVGGLLLFGAVFAINSALHSYLIIRHARSDKVSLDVGFYYMANAMGRLIGTVLSGLLFQLYNLQVCLLVSALFIVIAALLSLGIDQKPKLQKPS